VFVQVVLVKDFFVWFYSAAAVIIIIIIKTLETASEQLRTSVHASQNFSVVL